MRVCRWRATYFWKALNKSYNFSLDLTSIKGLHKKLWPSKILGVLILGMLAKWHLDVALVANHIEYYKGEGGGFPQVRAMV